MEGHHREQQSEPPDERQPPGTRIDADDAPVVEVAGDQEVHAHQFVTPVVAHERVEQRCEVHDVQRSDEQQERHHRVGEEPGEPGMHDAQQPLPGSRHRAVDRQRPQGERRRRTQHQQHRHEHVQRHVLDHVHAEHRRPVGPDSRSGRGDQQRAAGQPGHQPSRRPTVAAPAKAHHRSQVGRRQHQCGHAEEGVEPPEREQVGGCGRAGKPVAEQDVPHGRLLGEQARRGAHRHRGYRRQCGHRGQSAGQGPGGPAERVEDQPGEQCGAGHQAQAGVPGSGQRPGQECHQQRAVAEDDHSEPDGHHPYAPAHRRIGRGPGRGDLHPRENRQRRGEDDHRTRRVVVVEPLARVAGHRHRDHPQQGRDQHRGMPFPPHGEPQRQGEDRGAHRHGHPSAGCLRGRDRDAEAAAEQAADRHAGVGASLHDHHRQPGGQPQRRRPFGEQMRAKRRRVEHAALVGPGRDQHEHQSAQAGRTGEGGGEESEGLQRSPAGRGGGQGDRGHHPTGS